MTDHFPRLETATAERMKRGSIACRQQYWTVLKASGQGLREYLQGQVTQDMKGLSAVRGIHACLLTPQGKAVSELYVLQGAGEELILLVPSHVATETVARLRRFAVGYQLRIGIVDAFGVYIVYGADAGPGLSRLDLPAPDGDWLACSRHASDELFALRMSGQPDGFWLVGPNAQLASRFEDTMDEAQCEALRIIRGLPQFGTDWNEKEHPLNANLVEFAGVSFDKGCYVGQEVTSRMHWRGGIRKKLYRVALSESQPDCLPASLPAPVLTGGRVGELRSLALDPEGRAFGIALLPISLVDEGTGLRLENDTPVRVLEPCHA